MLRRGFVCRLTHRSPYGNRRHFFINGRKGQTRKALSIRSRRHQTDPDEYRRADHEHENCVMQKVHVDQPTDDRRLEMTAARTIRKLKDEACSAQDKSGEERSDRTCTVE